MVWSEGMSLKNPVTPSGINPTNDYVHNHKYKIYGFTDKETSAVGVALSTATPNLKLTCSLHAEYLNESRSLVQSTTGYILPINRQNTVVWF